MSSPNQDSPTMGSKKKPSKEASHKDGAGGGTGGGGKGKKTSKNKSKTALKVSESQQNTAQSPAPQVSATLMNPNFPIGMQSPPNMTPMTPYGSGGGASFYGQPSFQVPPQPLQPPMALPQGTEYQMMLHHLVTTLQEDIRQLNYRVKRLEDLNMAAAAGAGGVSTFGGSGGGGVAGGQLLHQQQQLQQQQQQQPAQPSTADNNNNKAMDVIVKMLQEIRSSQQMSSSAGKTTNTAEETPPPPHPSPSTPAKENTAGEGGQQQQQSLMEVAAKAPGGKTSAENVKKKARTAELINEVTRMIKEEKKTQPEKPQALPPKEANSGSNNKKTVPQETFAAKVDKIRGKMKKK